MIRPKCSELTALKIPSERDQPSALPREPPRGLGSVDGSATRMATGARPGPGTTAASEEADEDAAATLFPVRAGQRGPPRRAGERAPRQGVPSRQGS